MALPAKVVDLLKQIYAHRGFGDEKLVEEDADKAMECVLQEIVEHLYPAPNNRYMESSPIRTVMESAVGSLRLQRNERRRSKSQGVGKAQ